jgi:glutathione S-transferase
MNERLAMSDIILHHYPASPFAEKIRLILGYKKLAWKSVIIPTIMPKPDLTALTGGYRKTPVLQIGADIYCDTALIADVLEKIQPTPTLYPAAQAGLARTLAQWADTTLFWTAVPYVFQPIGMQAMFANVPLEHLQAFGADREAMRGSAPRMSVAEATGSLSVYLRRLEQMLVGGNPYLLGDAPCIADFSVYHPLWFVLQVPPVAGIMDAAPLLKAWAERMAAIGHHQFEPMRGCDALAIAVDSHPLTHDDAPFVDIDGIALGHPVAVTPTDYAHDPVTGQLVLASANEIAVRRSDARAGTVVVHFPRVGFQLKPAI